MSAGKMSQVLAATVLMTCLACRGQPSYDDELPPKFANHIASESIATAIVQRYGRNAHTNSAPATEAEREDPGVFHHVRGIVEAPDSSIYVLDSDEKRVARFDANSGRVRTVVRGGYGESAGQFLHPVQIRLDTAGNLYVLDSQLRRISWFDRAGRFLSSADVTERDPFDVLVQDSLLWVLRYFRRDVPDAVSLYTKSGDRVASVFPVSERTKAFALSYTGALTRTRDGSVLFGHTEPGRWTRLDREGHERELGEEALPTSNTTSEQLEDQLSRVHCPGGTIAIGELPGGEVAVLYATQYQPAKRAHWWRSPEPGPLYMSYYIDVFTSGGKFLGKTHIVPGAKITSAAFGQYSGALFIGVLQPVPSVLKLRVTPVAPRVARR